MKIHNKLVRDKIPKICLDAGATPLTKIITNDIDFNNLLIDKAIEELEELRSALTQTERIEERADIAEVLLKIDEMHDLSAKDVESTRIKKAKNRGGFDNRIFLISTDET